MPSFGADATDIRLADVVPVLDLHDSSADLHDLSILNARYQADGYLYFRGLLPLKAIEDTRHRMIAPLLERGLVREVGDQAEWIGGEALSLGQEAPEFQGVIQALFEAEGVKPVFEQLLGEEPSLVPIVQYRAGRPFGPTGNVHQDGFFSPGIEGFRPLWIPLVEMDEEMGGLALAVGVSDKGFLHNTDKMPMAPIPQDQVPAGAWARTNYAPGDVLVIHPGTPHVGLENKSKFVRFSIDTRIQALANPSVITGEIVGLSEDDVTLRFENGSERSFMIDDESFLRTGSFAGKRLTRAEFVDVTPRGLPVLASVGEDDRIKMLRRFAGG